MKHGKKRALVIVDHQNDFCDPSGSLYVDGAAEDIRRLAGHIGSAAADYDDIFVSLDSHDVVAIFHPVFWCGAYGEIPAPFTPVSRDDYASGRWRAASREHERHAVRMFDVMGKKGMDSLMIWPEHCVVSTWGHNVAWPLLKALGVWRARTGHAVRFVFKGENPYTEQFSIFEGIDDSWPETAFNENLSSRLLECGSVTFAGEALSHCVVESIASYVRRNSDRLRETGQEIRLLSDCSSPVASFSGRDCEERLASLGVRFVATAD